MPVRAAAICAAAPEFWFLATDTLVPSEDFRDHLRFVKELLYPTPDDDHRIMLLRDILSRRHSRAHVTCFWRGNSGEPAPQIPAYFRSAVKSLAADIETDFAIENS